MLRKTAILLPRSHKVTKKGALFYYWTLQNESFLKKSLCLSALVASLLNPA